MVSLTNVFMNYVNPLSFISALGHYQNLLSYDERVLYKFFHTGAEIRKCEHSFFPNHIARSVDTKFFDIFHFFKGFDGPFEMSRVRIDPFQRKLKIPDGVALCDILADDIQVFGLNLVEADVDAEVDEVFAF